MTPDTLYINAVTSLIPNINHTRTVDNERRYAVTVNGITTYTDSPSRMARLTQGGTIGQVTDRNAH